MVGQIVYVVCAEGEERLAELLAMPLRDVGYEVSHSGTIAVGESRVGEADIALASGHPIVLCATPRAIGTIWAHRITRAARVSGAPVRVFVVTMDEETYVDQVAFGGKVAKYYEDPAIAIGELLDALTKHFPVTRPVRRLAELTSTPVSDRPFLDQLTEARDVDLGAVEHFRAEMRPEFVARYPRELSVFEFLEYAGMLVDGWLTRTGVLLFGKNPIQFCPTAIVKCTRYYGADRGVARDNATYESTVPDQIVQAREFIAERVRVGETPSTGAAQSEVIYSYPMIAVREVIANALVHRDYEPPDSCVHIRLFDDRLEVSSPGTWLGIHLEPAVEYNLAALQRQSLKRNFRLAHILSGIRLVEGDGSGIPSALRDCAEADAPAPVVKSDEQFVHVIFRPRDATALRSISTRQSKPVRSPGDLNNLFRDREAELETLSRGIGSTDGPHFWLLTAPPGLGKTWLLERFRADLETDPSWTTRLVDASTIPDAVRDDPIALLSRMFGVPALTAADPNGVREIARDISRSRKGHLCLLDSAEVLDGSVARTLRAQLSQIYRLVGESHTTRARMAVVVASRSDDPWRGVTPAPRFAVLPLSEFTVGTVEDALRDLATATERTFDSSFTHAAESVSRLSGGLPALLPNSLRWIGEQEWLGLERLDSQELFTELTEPFVREILLGPDALLPRRGRQHSHSDQADAFQYALERALGVLSPFRLFTMSHLRHLAESHPSLRDSMMELGWSLEDFWIAIRQTALMRRPLDEPWEQIHPPIRRLIHRYHFPAPAARAEAHREARKFVAAWAENQHGKEQAIGLIECLWHEANSIGETQLILKEEVLTRSAVILSAALRPSPAYSLDEIRRYAVERITEDYELHDALKGVDGLFERLPAAIAQPGDYS